MLAENDDIRDSILKLPCPTCGNQLSYSAEKQLISCGHCGFSKDFDKANDLVREQSLARAASQQNQYKPKDLGKKVMNCGGCGAQLMVDSSEVSLRCNFCGSEKVNEKAFEQNLIQPQGILPFVVTKRQASEKFKDWIKKGWFHPNKLKKLAALGDVHGIYVPFWTFDAQTYTQWQGQAGYHYYENQTVYENGEQKTKRVRKTRWESKSGRFRQPFDDVLVVASRGLPEKIIERIFPYRLEETINYQNELVVGWESEIYSVDVQQGYQKAEHKMMEDLRNRARRELGGDEQRSLTVDSDFFEQTFKHLILPVWLCSYQYNGKSYQFAVNGQTGRINGEKPISTIKVIITVLIVVAIIGLIIFLSSGGEGS